MKPEHWYEVQIGDAVERCGDMMAGLDRAEARFAAAIVDDPMRYIAVRSIYVDANGEVSVTEMRGAHYAPSVGLDATYSIGSDTYGGRITAVARNGRALTFRASAGFQREFTLRKTGQYRTKGSHGAGFLYLGYARDYSDPSF